MSAFIDFYVGLPRQGPGDRGAPVAFVVVGICGDSRILDAGCGTGADIDGLLAFPHPAHFVAEPSEAARAFWDGEGEVLHVHDVIAATRAAGYNILGTAKLPDAAWEAYYEPKEARLAALFSEATGEMRDVLDAACTEIDGWRAVQSETGYTQIVAERP